MKKMREFLAFTLALTAVVSATGCNKNGESSNPYADVDVSADVRNKIKESVMTTDLLPDVELENKTIKWLATWDINPDVTGKNKPTELVAFEEKYGGKIEWIQCEHGDRYEKLAQMIDSGDGVDFFYAGDKDAFPKGAIRGMFVPVDDYIDFSSPLWEGVQEVNDSLIWNDKHYCTITQTTGDSVACVYNKKTVEEAGLTDPAELYANGEWTWDAFHDMLKSYVDVENEKFGIDSWWYEFGLMATTGVPAVEIQNGKLVSNISHPAMERVQNFMYDLYSSGSIAIGVGDYGWDSHPEYIGEGKLLFYPVGLYEFYMEKETWTDKYGEDVGFVPMPKDPESDEYYIPVGMEAYCFVKGGQNPEGVARYLDCKRFAILDETTSELGDQQFRDDYGWSEEMIEMKNSMQGLADANPFIDVSTGVSADCGELLDSQLRSSARGTPWNETYDAIYATLDIMLEDANNNSTENE